MLFALWGIILFLLLLLVFLHLIVFYRQRSPHEYSIQFSKTLSSLLENNVKTLETNLINRFTDITTQQRGQLDSFNKQIELLRKSNDDKMAQVILTIEQKLVALQQDNNKKLEQMRETVDEKLHKTLENRLGQNFKIITERLEHLHKALGEMQNLASGVHDLKKVLTNVKTKGILGEYQLESILEQILAPNQYQKDVKVNPLTNAMVEFAILLPEEVWIPLDAKFPTELYREILEAYDNLDKELIEKKQKSLYQVIKKYAKDISTKYISPPHTTDFAILFLPIEGLYAEIVRNSDVFEEIQRDYKIIIVGPTNFSAFLNSLRMGFRTLAIQQSSSEVWNILAKVKNDFSKFGGILSKTRKKIEEAGKELDNVDVRTRSIERNLRSVEEQNILGESSKQQQLELE